MRALDSDALTHRLGPVPGLEELRVAVARKHSHYLRETITADNVLITCGANQAFSVAIMALTESGDRVGLWTPYFFNHAMAIHSAGAEIAEFPLDARFQPDRAALLAAVGVAGSAMRVAALTSPHNPTGVVIDSGTIEMVADELGGRGIAFILDVSYDGLDYLSPRRRTPTLSIRNSILIGSFSKTHALAGWRIGFLVADKKFIGDVIGLYDAAQICAPTPSQVVAAAAMKASEDYHDNLRYELGRRRIALYEGLVRLPWIKSISGDAGVFLFAELQKGIKSWDVAVDLMVNECAVAAVPSHEVVPGSTQPRSVWGTKSEYLRFAYGMLSVPQIGEATARLEGLSVMS
jgi:polar amino acid transport system ATP-binding protein/arginine:pyruvate transaminase